MIVHFVVDEKIIDQMIDNFFKVSPDNMFLVFTESLNVRFVHISQEGLFIRRFNYKNEDINEVLTRIKPDAIIVHQLNFNFARVINQIREEINIAWVAWGFDVYSLPRIKPSLYARNTKSFLKLNNPFLSVEWIIKGNDLIRKLYYKLQGKSDPYSEIFNSISKIDFFCTYIKEDFEKFIKFYKYPNLKFSEIAFSTIDQYLGGNKSLRLNPEASNIIVGNSNTPECNYLDTIPKLAKKKDLISKIYFILSYGSNLRHKEEVITSGISQLGNKFIPITDFMSRQQYVEMLQSCSAGIFFHYRQQAMGNIIALLYLGARVYLSERNPAYYFFLRKGILVYSFEKAFDKYLNTKLTNKEAGINREQLDLIFSEEKVTCDLKHIIEALKS